MQGTSPLAGQGSEKATVNQQGHSLWGRPNVPFPAVEGRVKNEKNGRRHVPARHQEQELTHRSVDSQGALKPSA